MDTIDFAELAIRQVTADAMITELQARLAANGWTFGIQTGAGFRLLLANKGAGRLYLPGGKDGKWNTQVAQVRAVDTTTASGRLAGQPDLAEVPAWRVELEQSVPIELVLQVAEAAADDPGGVLVR